MITGFLLFAVAALGVLVWAQGRSITDLRLTATEDRADFQDAVGSAITDQDRLVELIRAGRGRIELARNLASDPVGDIRQSMAVLFDLTQAGPLSEDAIASVFSDAVDVIAGEAVEVH